MIRKAVIPAAGYGTRLLPATKAIPKELIPVVDTPTIQYVVDEAVSSGITDILIIVSRGKTAIQDHFGRHRELEGFLESRNKTAELDMIRNVAGGAAVHFVWQEEQNGLGDAIRYARAHVGNEPFAVLLGDTIMESTSGTAVTAQLIETREAHGGSVIAVQRVSRDRVSRYGIVDGEEKAPGVFSVKTMVEKPSPDDAPTNLAVASRYVLEPEIFDYLAATEPGKGGEIQLTDALNTLARESTMHARAVDGIRHDIGNRLEFVKANVYFGLKCDDIAPELGAWIKDLAESLGSDQ